ncbi:hypothetical protein CRG98_006041 [Punica granatum]|uniref:Uncharacterized protein n=1 Tax=Punica granatum TaxID=22663 RepID=A0A2I0KZ14_PUNGR|nr:hypothetical protein CRG98_006041 [Punica granatum]
MLEEARARWLGELAEQESKIAPVSRPSKTRQVCKDVNTHGLADPARLQDARARWLGELAVQESNLAQTRQVCKDVNTHGLADPARLQDARARWLGELAVQESNLAQTRQVCKDVNTHGLADPARLQDARARWLGELAVQESNLAQTRQVCKDVNTHGLADPARLQDARARWLGELAVQESNLAQTRQVCKDVNTHGLADPARLQDARARWLGELAVQESNLAQTRQVCKDVNTHGLADPARLQDARARWLGELAVQESNLAQTRQVCKDVNTHGLADPARLQDARARWLGELAVQESNLAQTRQVCKDVNTHGLADPARLQDARARWLGELAVQESNLAQTRQVCKDVNTHGLADPARLQDARARWLGELAVQESNLAQAGQGCKKHERGVSANLRCKKLNSHGLTVPAMLQEARARWLGELAVTERKLARISRPGKGARGTSEVARRTCGDGKKVIWQGLADPARLQEARARWLGELAVMESKLARISGPGKVARGTSETRQVCKNVNTHGLADPARLQEARARWLGELAVQESKLALVSRLGKVVRGTSEVARRTCVNSHGLADPARLQEARARWLGELAVQESKLALVSRLGKVVRGTSEVARRTCGAGKETRTGWQTWQGCNRHNEGDSTQQSCQRRARWLHELAMQKSKLAQVSRPGKVAIGTGEQARQTCGAGKKVNSHGLADPARLQEARARWLGELAVQESKLALVSRLGKVVRGTSEVARRTCGDGK